MTAATATPQQMRDRLLQAIDGQSNICNMVAVMEVISYLEKYPITKETLEETRLGKLINDVRKKTKDEDLAKRAKKLLRGWQKLIEPGQSEAPSKGHSTTPGSANGGTFPCRTELPPPAATPPSGKTVPELKSRNDFNNCYTPQAEKPGGRKRKGEQRDGQHLPAKISKTTAYEKVQNSPRLATNGLRVGPEAFTDTFDAPADFAAEHLDNDRLSKIPVNAVKPHPSSQSLAKPPSTSALLKAAVLQQQARLEQTAPAPAPPKSPRSSSHSPRTSRQDVVAKQPALSAPKVASLSSPALSPASLESSAPPGPSPSPSPRPLTPCVQVSFQDGPGAAESTLPWDGLADSDPHLQHSNRIPDSPRNSLHNSKALSLSEGAIKVEGDDSVSVIGRKKRKKYRPRDYTVNLDGQLGEESTKPVRLKDRRLTFDPVTGQIKPLSHKESYVETDVPPQPHWTEPPTQGSSNQNPPATPSPFQQTNWKELSRNEIIQSYLNRQSNVLTSSGAQTSGAHFFMTEYLKQEEDHVKEARKTHVMAPTLPDMDLPGVSREVTREELNRIHTQLWPGVNGCFDSKDKWYDWTECISLDPHGDESRLNILPYVCLD